VQTTYLAWQLATWFGARLERELGPLGLTRAQLNALQHAADNPGITSATAARRTGITPQSIGAAVAGLLEAGRLRRERHPDNARMGALFITEEGRRVLDEAQRAVSRLNEEALAALSTAERTELHRVLLALVSQHAPDVVPAEERRR